MLQPNGSIYPMPGTANPSMANTGAMYDVPNKRVTGTIMTQLLPFADPKALALLDAFERAVYGALT